MLPHDSGADTSVENGLPRASDRTGFAAMSIGILLGLVVLYFRVGAEQFALIGGGFLAISVGAFTIGVLGNLSRRPIRIWLSPSEIRAEFRDGRIIKITRGSLNSASFRTVRGDTFVRLHYASGRWENRVHIYGEGAAKVKEWFDASAAAHD
jgi:hypothetical protein